ncbi:glycoside hydrolase family 13 protein [bacterium]|nr:glycoside hydrolase family 13 protein [bacterium]
MVRIPEWVKKSVFYQIFPDRFACSRLLEKPGHLEPWESRPTLRGFKGGDLLGVTEKLDYLEELGINALYLNPIFKSTANHRYHTSDYFQVDPLLGGTSALQTLLEAAHQRGIRVILDGVFNHTGRGFYQFCHIIENGPSSPYRDWFYINNLPIKPFDAPIGKHGYYAWWDNPELPKLNVELPAVREFIYRVAEYWIGFGIDGWRLDVPEEIKVPNFWQTFRTRTKAKNRQAYLLGEIWHEAPEWLRGDRFDAVMNYPLTRICLGYFLGARLDQALLARTSFRSIRPLTGTEFLTEADRLYRLYAPEVSLAQFNLLGSHDLPRFKTMAGRDRTSFELAFLFLVTYPGTPCLYYGDEIGLEGEHDPGCRAAFPWQEQSWDKELQAYVRRCLKLRNSHEALQQGLFQPIWATSDLISFIRKAETETLLVILNNAPKAVTFQLPSDSTLPRHALLVPVFPDAGPARDRIDEASPLTVEIGPRSGHVFQISIPCIA